MFFWFLFRDDVVGLFIDILKEFDTVEVDDASMIDDHMLIIDCIHSSTKSYYSHKVRVNFYHTPIHCKP